MKLKTKLVRHKTLFQLTIVPFEPKAFGPSRNVVEKKRELSTAITQRLSEATLATVKARLKGQLVKITMAFYLWRGDAKQPDTSP